MFSCLHRFQLIIDHIIHIFIYTDEMLHTQLRGRHTKKGGHQDRRTYRKVDIQTGVTFSIESLSEENGIQVGVVVQSLPHCSLNRETAALVLSSWTRIQFSIQTNRQFWKINIDKWWHHMSWCPSVPYVFILPLWFPTAALCVDQTFLQAPFGSGAEHINCYRSLSGS